MAKAYTLISGLMLLILFSTASAQTETVRTDKSSGVTITASATGDRVRFTAPASVVQIRLEVYNQTGKKLLDDEVRGGNVLDWHLQDGQAEPLADDAYLCVVTVKSLSGRITERIGSVIVERSSASVRAFDASQMTAQQSQAIGPVEENATLTVLKEDDHHTTTVIAHNGEEGEIARGRGALSFRIGDFFSGKDVEQMRLTPEGNLGIGITHPQARLDVDGLIRSSLGIVFPDGSIQYSAATRTYGAKSTLPGSSLQRNLKNSRGGQEHIEAVLQNYIPKFTDNGGTLGNTAAPIYETVGGNVGIGTTTPDPFKLNVNGALNVGGSNLYLGGSLRFTDNAAAGYTNFLALNGNLTNFDGVNYEQLNLYNPGGNQAIHLAQTAIGSQIASIGTGNTSLLLQPSGGNVGIGLSAGIPTYPLHVKGTTGTGASQGVAEFASATDDTGVRINNQAFQGRTWTLFSSGGNSALGAGTFSIYDATGGQAKLTINQLGGVDIPSGSFFLRSSTAQPNFLIFTVADSTNSAIFGVTSDRRIFLGGPVQVSGGTVFIANPNSLIITSPNGNCWFITVDNTGALSTFSVACP